MMMTRRWPLRHLVSRCGAIIGVMNASIPSLFRRTLGIAAWWISVVALPLLMVSLALSFHLTTRRESLLVGQGLVPIIRMARRKNHWVMVSSGRFLSGVR